MAVTGPTTSVAELRRRFEESKASNTSKRALNGDAVVDAALATREARTAIRRDTGRDVPVEAIYEEQQALLAQFEAQQRQAALDNIFAQTLQQAMSSGVSDDVAFQRATDAVTAFKLSA